MLVTYKHIRILVMATVFRPAPENGLFLSGPVCTTRSIIHFCKNQYEELLFSHVGKSVNYSTTREHIHVPVKATTRWRG